MKRQKTMKIVDVIRLLGGRHVTRYDSVALKRYSRSLSGRIHRYALPYMERLQALRDRRLGARADLMEYMGAQGGQHALYAPDLPWLSLFETQVCSAFKHFIEADSGNSVVRGMAFLKALAPAFPWPDTIDDGSLEVQVEIPCPGIRTSPGKLPRIDLMITVKSCGDAYGAVIEVKTGYQDVKNPLSHYRKFAEENGLVLEAGEAPATGVLIVLVPRSRRGLERRLANHHNRHWKVIEWPVLLRRFERYVWQDDESFRQFRKLVWKKVGE